MSVASPAYRAWLLGLLLASYACSFVDRIIVAVVGPALVRDLGLSDLQFGLLGGMAFALFYSAFGIPLARLAERGNRRSLLSVCVALWSVMTMLCGMATSYPALLAFRMGVGVGEAGCSPAAHSMISDHFPPGRRAAALSVYTAGVPIGILLGALAGGWLAQRFDWRTAFLVVGAPGLLLAVLIRWGLHEPARGRLEGMADDGRAPSLGETLRHLGGRPSFLHAAAGLTLTSLAANGINLFAPTYLVRRFGLGLAEVGLAFGLASGLSGILGLALGGLAVDRGVRRDARFYAWVPAFGALLSAPLHLAAYSQSTALATFILIGLGGIAVSCGFGASFALAQNLALPRMRASATALVLLAMNLAGQGLGPLALGLASDVLARRAFAGGDFEDMCRAGAPAACTEASATGLQQAILVTCACFLWGAAHHVLAARSVPRDLARCGR